MLFIAVTGPVACGKSTIVKYFHGMWPDVVEVVQADNYYFDQSHVPVERRSEAFIDYDSPSAINFERLFQDLERLRRAKWSRTLRGITFRRTRLRRRSV